MSSKSAAKVPAPYPNCFPSQISMSSMRSCCRREPVFSAMELAFLCLRKLLTNHFDYVSIFARKAVAA